MESHQGQKRLSPAAGVPGLTAEVPVLTAGVSGLATGVSAVTTVHYFGGVGTDSFSNLNFDLYIIFYKKFKILLTYISVIYYFKYFVSPGTPPLVVGVFDLEGFP